MSEGAEKLLIPAEFYFQASAPARYVERLEATIRGQQHPNGLIPLPDLSFSTPPDRPEIGIGWNDEGLAIQLTLTGKRSFKPPQSKLNPESGDYFDIYLDTRDLKTNHRPSRFCHCFRLTIDPKATSPLKIVRKSLSGEYGDASQKMTVEIPGYFSKTATQERATVWLAQENLFGFDPENVSTLGFYYHLHQIDQGDFHFGPGPGFPFSSDPSLWASLKLIR